MKKIIIAIILIIFLSSLTYATDSETRSNYYWDSLNYVADGINSTGDQTINGSNPTNGQNMQNFGWAAGNNAVWSTNEAYKGSGAIEYDMGTGVALKYTFNTQNDSFKGRCELKHLMRGSSTDFNYTWIEVGEGNTVTSAIAFDTRDFTQGWGYGAGAGENCDENTIPVENGWQTLMFNFTGGNLETYVNGTLCHVFVGETTFKAIYVYTGGGFGHGYIDDVVCYNGYTRPTSGGAPPVSKEIEEIYNVSTFENEINEFRLIFKNYNANSSSKAYLVYNNVSYEASVNYVNSSYLFFNYSLTSPYVQFNKSNISFFWNYSINNTGSYNQTSENNQTILQYLRNISLEYETFGFENETTQFKLIFKNFVINNTSSANLIYNNTSYSGTINYTNHSYVEYIYNYIPDFVRINNTEYNFHWNYTLISPLSWVNNTNNVTPNYAQNIIWSITKSYVTVTAKNNQSGNPINNFYVNVSSDDYGTGYIYNTTTGSINIPQINSGLKVLNVWGNTYASENYNVTFPSGDSTSLEAQLIEMGAIWISVYTEDDGTAVNGADIRIINYDGDIDLTTDTGGDNEYYSLINETGNISITVWLEGSYTEKIYYELMQTGRYINLNAYILSENDTQDTTFTVKNEFSQLVSDAQLSFYTSVDGNFVKVGQVKTDFSGIAVANLDPTSTYMLRVTANGYLQKEVTFIPTSTSYTVSLEGDSLDYTRLFDNIDYHIEPTNSKGLDSNTSYNFLFSISSSQNNLEYWGVKVTFENGSVYLDNHTDSSGGIAVIPLTMPLNSTDLEATYFFHIYGEEYWEKNIIYYVYPQAQGLYTFDSALDDEDDNFTGFEKAIIMTFLTLGIVGFTAWRIGFNTLLIGIEIMIIFGFFAYKEWIPLWVYAIILVPTIIIAYLTRGGES